MKNEKYVAYVGTYTHQHSIGIHIYDMDVNGGSMSERKVVPINNPSNLIVSHSGKFLYSIEDGGVMAFCILEDGDLEPLNQMWIGGMRGCTIKIDKDDRYLFIGGYHDGRVSMMRLNEDGSIAGIADGIFHKGLGVGYAEKSARPHVTCVELTPDGKYLCAADCGLDQVKIYQIDYVNGKLKLADILRCDIDSAPRKMRFSKDGRFIYILCEIKNAVDVYFYADGAEGPEFTKVQSISTLKKAEDRIGRAACGINLSADGKHLICTNAGDDTATLYEVNTMDGTLTMLCNEPISGEFPKAVGIYPDGKHFMTLNHETDQICTFKINFEDNYFLMEGKPLKIETPNSICIHKLA